MCICSPTEQNRKTYNRISELLSGETNPNPGKILADFDNAALNAFSKNSPTQKNRGVFSTWSNLVTGKIIEIGLKTYNHLPEFNLALRMLPPLAHVPPTHVKASFEPVIQEVTDVIQKEIFEESVVEKIDELTKYFESNYIENPIANKKPPFPIEIWNQYHAA